jgi:hypothetical protein
MAKRGHFNEMASFWLCWLKMIWVRGKTLKLEKQPQGKVDGFSYL